MPDNFSTGFTSMSDLDTFDAEFNGDVTAFVARRVRDRASALDRAIIEAYRRGDAVYDDVQEDGTTVRYDLAAVRDNPERHAVFMRLADNP